MLLQICPQVIPGWDQGLLGVCKGEERHLVVPSTLAYGDRGAGDVIPPDATLLFDIVVVDVIKAKSPEDIRREKEEEERRRAAAAAEAKAARRRAEQGIGTALGNSPVGDSNNNGRVEKAIQEIGTYH